MSSVPAIALDRTYRLVTRSDFDGLVCAALLTELGYRYVAFNPGA